MSTKVFYVTALFIFVLQSCGIKSGVRNEIFTHGMILSSTMWSVTSAYYFKEKHYIVRTTDNSNGQMDKRISEEGTFSVCKNILTMSPQIRLICPKLISHNYTKSHVMYTDEFKTDSIYVRGTMRCNAISEYILADKDTLQSENIKVLGFSTRSYTIFKSDDRIYLRNNERPDEVLESYNGPLIKK